MAGTIKSYSRQGSAGEVWILPEEFERGRPPQRGAVPTIPPRLRGRSSWSDVDPTTCGPGAQTGTRRSWYEGTPRVHTVANSIPLRAPVQRFDDPRPRPVLAAPEDRHSPAGAETDRDALSSPIIHHASAGSGSHHRASLGISAGSSRSGHAASISARTESIWKIPPAAPAGPS